eukprot:TRINITY_DN45315_c0_g1_i1.p1 TRINITY_DN45315_c0_g1~~TRINITY_DN45315_c0_g1_i1.p1  ORF type:complete len:165 (+),score=17.38 TRINITY_DN45315_c0_g1_i1:134-628(+)
MIRRPPRSTLSSSSAASDVYKRQVSTQSTGARTGGKWECRLPEGRPLPKYFAPPHWETGTPDWFSRPNYKHTCVKWPWNQTPKVQGFARTRCFDSRKQAEASRREQITSGYAWVDARWQERLSASDGSHGTLSPETTGSVWKTVSRWDVPMRTVARSSPKDWRT